MLKHNLLLPVEYRHSLHAGKLRGGDSLRGTVFGDSNKPNVPFK